MQMNTRIAELHKCQVTVKMVYIHNVCSFNIPFYLATGIMDRAAIRIGGTQGKYKKWGPDCARGV